MFRNLRIKRKPDDLLVDPSALSGEWLAKDAEAHIRVGQINNLPENTKKRVYRLILPAELLTRFNIDPITWKGSQGEERVLIRAEPGSTVVHIWVIDGNEPSMEFFRLEFADNAFHGIDLHLLLLNDPDSKYFQTDKGELQRADRFAGIHHHAL